MKSSSQMKDIYCSNCGKTDHNFKGCPEPISSYGIILINIDLDKSLNDKIKSGLLNKYNDPVNILSNEVGIEIKDYGDMELFSCLKNSVKFLMIQRKHTLGFLEFIRGRYNIDNVDGLIFLFKQMTPEEIQRIRDNTFDDLWNFVWGHKNKHNFQNEYLTSKDKFTKLKREDNGNLSLKFYIENVSPNWSYAEWGFPKGRRNNKESDLECALREFREESNFEDKDFIILDKIEPLEESLIGTNGVNYRHIYYVAMSVGNKVPEIDANNYIQNCEIGDIKYFTYDEAVDIIRNYHVDKQKLLTILYINVINNIISDLKKINYTT